MQRQHAAINRLTFLQHMLFTEKKCLHRNALFAAYWSGGVIGPYLFANEADNTITVNREPYRDIIKVDRLRGFWITNPMQISIRENLTKCCQILPPPVSVPFYIDQSDCSIPQLPGHVLSYVTELGH